MQSKTKASLAQLVEHDTLNVGVLGSSPRGSTKMAMISHRHFCFVRAARTQDSPLRRGPGGIDKAQLCASAHEPQREHKKGDGFPSPFLCSAAACSIPTQPPQRGGVSSLSFSSPFLCMDYSNLISYCRKPHQ